MHDHHARGLGGDFGAGHGGGDAAPGKRTRTSSLPVQRKAAAPAAGDASAGSGPAPAGEDPFGLHLLGTPPAGGAAGGLPAGVQAQMEASFGYDLSSVRVHQGGAADAMGARAFATGSDLHFGAGEYAPESAGGLHLLAHELAHVTQQAMGRAPAGLHAKLAGMLLDDPLEREADGMADRAVRGEPAWAGANAGPLRSLPSLAGAPAMPKLKVGSNWIKAAQTIAERVVQNGGDHQIVAILQRWAKDNKKKDRDFGSWALAIAAAREELDAQDSSSESDDDPGGEPDDPGGDGGGGGGAGRSRLCKLLLLFFILLLVIGGPALGMLAMGMNRYEVRPGMHDTAMTTRRQLEPLMQVGSHERLMELAQHSMVETLRQHTAVLPVDAFLDGHPELEQMMPDVSRLRRIEQELDVIGPQLEALGPALHQVQPVLEQLGPNNLDNPHNTGVYHEHIFLEPPPTTSKVESNPLTKGSEQSPLHPPDLGFFHDGVHGDRDDMMPAYIAPQHHYDRALMERAALDVARDYGHYKGITHNCQDYVDAVVAHYKTLGGKEVVPTTRSAVTLAITDLLTGWGGSLLDKEIAKTVGEELASLPKAVDGGSECAQVVSAKLGLDAGTFAGAIDEVLGQTIAVPGQGPMTIRKALCEPIRGDLMDSGLAMISVHMDDPVTLPEEGPTTIRQTLCAPKGDQGEHALKGIVFELARIKGGAKIREAIPWPINTDPLATAKMETDLTNRLAENLYARLNLKGLCG